MKLYIFSFVFLISTTIFAQETPQQTFAAPAMDEEEIDIEKVLQDPGFRSFLLNTRNAIPQVIDPAMLEFPPLGKVQVGERKNLDHPVNVEISDLSGRIQTQLLTALENLQNQDTAGYKQRKTEYTNLRIDNRQGELQNTDRELDLAIDGAAFFRLENKETGEIVYTRCGEFELAPGGYISLITGNVVRRIDPAIVIPENYQSIKIEPNGNVYVGIDSTEANQLVGSITLSRFPNPARLKPIDSHFFAETELSGPPTDFTPIREVDAKIRQNTLEKSNVNIEKLRQEIERLFELKKLLRAVAEP